MVTDLVNALEMAKDNASFVCDILAAIAFTSLPETQNAQAKAPNLEYKIRLPSSPRNSGKQHFGFGLTSGDTQWNTEFMFPLFQRVGPREKKMEWGGDPGKCNLTLN